MAKTFDHIISLGLNCEIAHQLRINHGFVESGLLTWAASPAESLESVLANSDLVISKGLCAVPALNMFVCQATKIYFHGRRRPQDVLDASGKPNPVIVDEEMRECASRISHLRDKASHLAISDESKLYIVGLHPEYLGASADNLHEFVNVVRNALTSTARYASLLVIAEERQKETLKGCEEHSDLYIRFVSYFAPRSQATSAEAAATADYIRIFQEFVPTKMRTDHKTYKYDH